MRTVAAAGILLCLLGLSTARYFTALHFLPAALVVAAGACAAVLYSTGLQRVLELWTSAAESREQCEVRRWTCDRLALGLVAGGIFGFLVGSFIALQNLDNTVNARMGLGIGLASLSLATAVLFSIVEPTAARWRLQDYEPDEDSPSFSMYWLGLVVTNVLAVMAVSFFLFLAI